MVRSRGGATSGIYICVCMRMHACHASLSVCVFVCKFVCVYVCLCVFEKRGRGWERRLSTVSQTGG